MVFRHLIRDSSDCPPRTPTLAADTAEEDAVNSTVADARRRWAAFPVRMAVTLACLVLVTAACSGQSNPGSPAGSIPASSAKVIVMCSLVTKADVAEGDGMAT